MIGLSDRADDEEINTLALDDPIGLYIARRKRKYLRWLCGCEIETGYGTKDSFLELTNRVAEPIKDNNNKLQYRPGVSPTAEQRRLESYGKSKIRLYGSNACQRSDAGEATWKWSKFARRQDSTTRTSSRQPLTKKQKAKAEDFRFVGEHPKISES